MQVLEPIVAPVISDKCETAPEFEETLCHFYCLHDPNTGYCGTDISDEEEVDEETVNCAVCTELGETLFNKDICPRTGKPCSDECLDGI